MRTLANTLQRERDATFEQLDARVLFVDGTDQGTSLTVHFLCGLGDFCQLGVALREHFGEFLHTLFQLLTPRHWQEASDADSALQFCDQPSPDREGLTTFFVVLILARALCLLRRLELRAHCGELLLQVREQTLYKNEF